MSRIKITDTIQDMLFSMCDGNPGALNVLMGILTQGSTIDPDNAFEGIGPIMFLDTLEIYGSRIYMLCHDCCGKNLVAMLTMLRAVQLGLYSGEQLNEDIGKDLGGRGKDITDKAAELIVEV